ncbi:LysR family transcriptional regulator [Vibrio sp. ES.051]|uniref:LysR substrate-binding domain-containing protein n=1 Tax=Vibrio sp. ES.051 TaxID=1761909 RepID=UPI000BF7402B|nr:LysR substrate-binding domain-containing protein [Vibrio sp. ES.051]PFG57939.1 LysR family transcriptional regulator [Vibrio sp. ES.051]
MIVDKSQVRLLDLVVLNTFIKVVDNKGFTSAADELHLAQSTVSAHIKRLEDTVEGRVLEKGQRVPTPTSIGTKVLAHARRLINQNTLAWQDISEQRIDGVVRLGIPDDYLVYIPKVLAEFESHFPDVELQVYCGLSVELLDKMQSKMLDLAVTTRQPNSPGGEVLCREKTVWAGAPGFDMHQRSPLPLAVSTDGLCIFRQRGIEALNSASIPWRIAYTSASLSALTAAVKAGLAVTILTPSMLVPGLEVLSETKGLPTLPMTEIALHQQNDVDLNEASKKLAEEIKRHIQTSEASRVKLL